MKVSLDESVLHSILLRVKSWSNRMCLCMALVFKSKIPLSLTRSFLFSSSLPDGHYAGSNGPTTTSSGGSGMNGEIPSVPITTLAGIASLTDRKLLLRYHLKSIQVCRAVGRKRNFRVLLPRPFCSRGIKF